MPQIFVKLFKIKHFYFFLAVTERVHFNQKSVFNENIYLLTNPCITEGRD